MISRRKPGIQVHLGWHRKIIRVHLGHAGHLGDALSIPRGNAVHRLDDELWRHHLARLQFVCQFAPSGCVRR